MSRVRFDKDPGYTKERQPHAVAADPDAELQRLIDLNEGRALTNEEIDELIQLRLLEHGLFTEEAELDADSYRTNDDRDPACKEY